MQFPVNPYIIVGYFHPPKTTSINHMVAPEEKSGNCQSYWDSFAWENGNHST